MEHLFPHWAGFASLTAECLETETPHPDELSCLSPVARPARRRDFALGRLAARRAVRALGYPSTPILLRPDGLPCWPQGLVGSITHSSGVAAAVVAPVECTAGVGLDVESMSRVRDHAVSRLIADSDEQRWINGRVERLIAVFSAKESVYKALYASHGASVGFHQVHLTPVSGGFDARLNVSISGRRSGTTLPVRCHVGRSFVWSGTWLPREGPIHW